MALIQVDVPWHFISGSLALLHRIAVALERIAGPELTSASFPSRKSGISDLHVADSAHIADLRQREEAVAKDMGVIPRSPAYFDRIPEYERNVRVSLGDDAARQLPWNLSKTPSQYQK